MNNKPVKKILLIEDAGTYRELYRRFLNQDESYNWQIFMAENGETGLKLYQELKPDLILLDYALPDLDGLRFLERINIGNKIKKLPVLMLTGQGEEELIINAFKQGIQGYLSKDKLSFKTFLWEIHESIENYKIWQENEKNQQKRELFYQIALKIRGVNKLQNILETTVREVREILESDRVLIYQLEADMSGKVTAESVGEDWQVSVGSKTKYNCWGKITRENFVTGKISAINNINKKRLSNNYLKCLRRWGVKAELVIPIIINEENKSEGNLWGLLIAHQCSNAREWEETEIELLEDLSIQIAIAIQQAKLYKNLEEKVEERTKELKESERRFRQMADAAPVLIWMSDTEGNCKFFNQIWLDFRGKTLAEEIDNGWIKGVHPEDRDFCFQSYLSAFQERKRFTMEYRLKRADGVYRWVLDTGVPRYTEDGKFMGYIGSCVDITERKESEKLLQQINYELEKRVAKRTAELQASEAKFRQFAERIEDVFWMTNLKENKTEYVSPAYEKVWQRNIKEIYINNGAWSDAIHPEDRERVMIASQRNENLEGDYDVEYRIIRPSGEMRWIRDRAFYIYNKQGEVERIIGVAEDITDKKQARDELTQSQARLKYLLSSSPTVIYSAKVSGDFGATFMSENVREHFGYEAEEFTGNSEFWFSHIHPEDQGLVLKQLEDLFEGNHKAIEYRFQHKNGEYRWVRDEIKLIRDTEGNPKEIIGSWTDFTALKEVQQSLEINEKRFAITLKTSPITIFNNDLNLCYTWIYSPLQGYDSENVCGKTDLELFSSEEAENLIRIKQEVISSGVSKRDIVCLNINGENRYFDNSIEPLKNELGEIIGITGVALDVTERYQQEEVIIELNKTLREKAAELELAYQEISDSKQFIENVINAVSDPIFVKDRQGRLQLTNDSLCLLVGNEKQKLLGRTVYDEFRKEEADVFTEKDELVLRTGEVNINEEYLTDTQGETHYISTKKSCFIDAKGNKFIVGVIRDLTERKKIEEALRRSEARFQRIVANVPGGIYQFVLRKDGEREFPYISDRFQEIFELESRENLTANIFNKIHPEDRKYLETLIVVSAENITQFVWEGRLLLPSGKIKWMEVLSQPEQQENGDMLWDGLIVEITERKETERQLLEQLSLSKLRLEIINALTQGDNLQVSLQKCTEALVNNLNVVLGRIWLLNQEENILELQASAGIYTRINGEHGRIRVGEYKIGKIAELRRYLVTNSVIGDEAIHKQEWAKKEGITAFVGYPLLLENELMGVMAMFGRQPFTETVVKELEAIANFIALGVEQQRQEEALLRSEKRYRQIVETAQEGIWLIDQQAKTTYVNPQMANMLGYRIEEMLGSYLSDFMDEVARVEAERNFAKRQHGIEETHDFRFKRKDGSDLWTMVSTTVMHNELGEFEGALGMIADITERVKIEETLRETNYKLVKLNAELERATRLKNEFLANMSHELRTPLNSILGLSEALKIELYGKLTQSQKAPLNTIENSGKHLLDLINDILDLAKIEAGKMELHIATFRVKQLCQESLTFIQQQAYDKNINLSVKIPEIEIVADERRMRQALINLLSNAVKFTPEGGFITLEVEANVTEKNVSQDGVRGWITFNVIDTGIGIAEENLSQIFQPFCQIDSSLSRRYAGTGLGLALVSSIADLHGGKVSVVSEVGVGSKFTITIPCLLFPTDKNLPQQLGEKGDNPPPLLSGETSKFTKVRAKCGKILIADDNDANIEIFSDYLRAKGYELRRAQNGLEAINMALKERPNIILMDIQMPEMDGLTAIKQIRTLEQVKDIPIIALTALAMTGDREKCLEAGANEYLTKPVRLSQLAALIQSLI